MKSKLKWTGIVHHLKTIQPYYDEIQSGLKTFELRKDDRNYQIGDRLDLFEGSDDIDLDDPQLGLRNHVHVFVTYKLTGGKFGLKKGYCILGITRANIDL